MWQPTFDVVSWKRPRWCKLSPQTQRLSLIPQSFCQTMGRVYLIHVHSTSPTSVASLQTWSPWLARTSCCVGVQGDMSFSSCQQRHAWILPQRAPKLFTNNYPGEQMFHSLYRFLDIFEFPIVPREVTPEL